MRRDIAKLSEGDHDKPIVEGGTTHRTIGRTLWRTITAVWLRTLTSRHTGIGVTAPTAELCWW